jgi:2-methylcitrate dehydratase PrpD
MTSAATKIVSDPSFLSSSMAVARFIHGLRFVAVPSEVQRETRLCLLDTLGVAFAGTALPVAGIIRRFAVRHLAAGEGRGARMIRDARRVSIPGAAMAGAAIIDGFDGHDGHALCKGHAGVTVVPAALAFADALALTDRDEFLTLVLLGYEIGTRAGIALHATSPTMHSSGAWNALAAAAIGSRMLRLSQGETAHALGIAEYYGPRSRLMRIIEHPTMLKDGSTMGAFAGVSAACLAADGFTGAPADTVGLEGLPGSVAAAGTAACAGDPAPWRDLGSRWRILEQYRKIDPVCRWTQPAVEAILSLRRRYPQMTHTDVTAVEVETFHEAASLSCREPAETDAAQYSLPFVVAATLVHGRLTVAEIAGKGLDDEAVLRLSRIAKPVERDDFNARFPAERWASVRLTLRDGTTLDSGPHTTRGDPATPLALESLIAKFRSNASAALEESTAQQIVERILDTRSRSELPTLLDLVLT